MGLLEKLQASGGHMVCDTAPCAGPYWYLKKQGVQVMAINSAKANYYAHGLCGMETWFGSTEACVESAISGKWEGPR
jgi:predicted aconitase